MNYLVAVDHSPVKAAKRARDGMIACGPLEHQSEHPEKQGRIYTATPTGENGYMFGRADIQELGGEWSPLSGVPPEATPEPEKE